MKYKLILLSLIVSLFVVPKTTIAQLSDEDKALWIAKGIPEGTTWANENRITNFTIAVFGNSFVYDELKNLSTFKTIKGKRFDVIRFNSLEDIKPVQILYIPKNEPQVLQKIINRVTQNTLVITDGCPEKYKHFYMLNFLEENTYEKPLTMNRTLASTAGIRFAESFITKAGTWEDKIKLLLATIDSIQNVKKKLKVESQRFEKNVAYIDSLKKENTKEREDIIAQKRIGEQQSIEIEAQKIRLENQKLMLDSVQSELTIQQERLDSNKVRLNQQMSRMKAQQIIVDSTGKELEKLNLEIKRNAEILEGKNIEISEKGQKIKVYSLAIVGFSVLAVLILVLAYFLWRGNKLKQKVNEELREKNEAINRQKDEIASRNRETELLNKELEKLSIVAEHTDNAVTIMDEKGNFEWVNVGFTQLFGYTLQLLLNEKSENIRNFTEYKAFPRVFEKCIKEKKTIVYDAVETTRTGKKIWVKTSLTPVVGDDSNVNQLITISADVTEIIEVDEELRKQNEKILEQTKQLEAKNKELELLSLVASETDNAISIMDAAGNIQWINTGFSKLYGYTYEQLLEEYSGNIITVDMDSKIKILIKKCIEERVPVSYENLITTLWGRKVWVQTTLTPLADKLGHTKSIISISQNIDEQKTAEQAITKQREELIVQKDELEHQKDRIELQNYHINKSIRYAKNIQSAVLPLKSTLDQFFETFIVYKPKDIVSGDFYWYYYLANANNGKGKHFIAAVDCTGHGVPGAFMSLIGYRLLNELVREKGVNKPSLILERMNNRIIHDLRQKETENNDGMDVCLCSIEYQDNGTINVVFAGAKRPLFYYKHLKKKIVHIKGTRKTIGGTAARHNELVFADHEIELQKGDILYLTSDGLIDQPSPLRKRFGSNRFMKVLNAIADEPVDFQYSAIEAALSEYKQNEDQRDDITCIGVKV